MISTATFIFLVVFCFVTNLICFVFGAYIMHCKNTGRNPLKDAGFYIPHDDGGAKTPEEQKGFYE
jgi:hypothetical protein